jgi:Secretion system C-terminal sorting domain
MKKYLLVLLIGCFFTCNNAVAQQSENIKGIATIVTPAKTESTAQIMARVNTSPQISNAAIERFSYPDFSQALQHPFSKPWSQFPPQGSNGTNKETNSLSIAAQTPSISFNAVTGPAETGNIILPDNMGAIGPAQYITLVNGRLRSFNKMTGIADGVLNIDPTVFFASVLTPAGGGVTQGGAQSPQMRYDRLSGKWILIMLDAPSSGGIPLANRIMIAFSNTSVITAATVWTFSQFTAEANHLAVYESLGMDANALYIGAPTLVLPAQSFGGKNCYVINRNTLLSGGTYTVTSFLELTDIFLPRGVDNFDPAPTEGYFIGNGSGTMILRRVIDPAGVPSLSTGIIIPGTTISAGRGPSKIPFLGASNLNFWLNPQDERFTSAIIRNGHLWTCQNISVDETGAAVINSTANRRNGVRWYDLQNISITPTVFQSGTIFDATASAGNPRWYSFPSLMISGQGHAAFSLSTGGNVDRLNAAFAGRLSEDPLGNTRAEVLTTASNTAFNVSSLSSAGQRWGDYSNVSLDPLDDMTMWMINEYCVGTNQFGCNVTKLLAPLPATPASCSPALTAAGQASVNIIVTGTSIDGSGFYDPGTNLPSPAQPFSHISATVSGGVTVNSVTYTDPTHITLNISTVGASQGAKTITVINPDGQSVISPSLLNISGTLPVSLISFTAKKIDNHAQLEWITAQEQNNRGFEIQRCTDANFAGSNTTVIGFINGKGTTSSESRYQFADITPQRGKNYYRLKQIDFDSRYVYGEVRRVDFDNKAEPVISPNPFSDRLLITNVPDKTAYKIINAGGQIMIQGVLINNTINTDRLAKGTYLLQLNRGEDTKTIKLVKK